MNLTIEKAKETFNRFKHLQKPMEDPILQKELKLAIYSFKEAKGFIEGWNQGIEAIEKGIVESQNPLSVDRESVLIFARNLKVEGEK